MYSSIIPSCVGFVVAIIVLLNSWFTLFYIPYHSHEMFSYIIPSGVGVFFVETIVLLNSWLTLFYVPYFSQEMLSSIIPSNWGLLRRHIVLLNCRLQYFMFISFMKMFPSIIPFIYHPVHLSFHLVVGSFVIIIVY